MSAEGDRASVIPTDTATKLLYSLGALISIIMSVGTGIPACVLVRSFRRNYEMRRLNLFSRLRVSAFCRRDAPLTTAGEVIGCWESRRIPFNLIVGTTGVITCIVGVVVSEASSILFGIDGFHSRSGLFRFVDPDCGNSDWSGGHLRFSKTLFRHPLEAIPNERCRRGTHSTIHSNRYL